MAATRARSIAYTRRHEPAQRALEARLARSIGASVELRAFGGALLFEPDAIVGASGNPMRVFTPYWRRCLAAGVPTARFEVLTRADAPWPADWTTPVVLKPSRQGSSVGLQFVDEPAQFPKALAQSLGFGGEVLMEPRILGRETTVGILDGQALPIVEVRPHGGVYDYTNKYTAGRTEYLCPADFPPATTAAIQQAALGAFRAIGGRDYARVDIMVQPDGSPVVLEVNTLPGMTATSLLPKAAAAAGMNFEQLCQRLTDLALDHSLLRS